MIAIVTFWALVSNASAQTPRAVVLPPTGDSLVVSEVRAQVITSLGELLETEGFEVVGSERIERLPEAMRTCTVGTCVRELITTVQATVAVGCSVWPREEGGLRISVTFIDAQGGAFDGTADAATATDLRLLVGRALRAARAAQAMGEGPWLEVRGTPIGARVTIDGAHSGTMPYRMRASPGSHAVLVELEGYASEQRTVEVTNNTSSVHVVEVALSRGSAREEESTRQASTVDIVLGVSGLVLGGAAIANGAYGLAVDGDCDSPPDASGRCERHDFGAIGITSFVIGGLLAVGGVAILLTKPFGFDVQVDAHGARARATLEL